MPQEYPQEVQVTHITVAERDALRGFNARMRSNLEAFLKVAETIPVDTKQFLNACSDAAVLIAEQQMAGIK